MDVALVRWPDEAERRDLLAAAGQPRLLLIEGGVHPPELAGCLEDWIRAPAPDGDLRSRLAALAQRAGEHEAEAPVVDDDGVLRFGPGWVALPPVEARLTAALVDRFGAVVSRDALGRAGWPAGAPGRNALDVHVLRLRRRVHGIGLVIRTVRSRGYVLASQASSR